MGSVLIQLIRHGRVASHRGDVPITDEGREEVRQAGLALSRSVGRHEDVHVLCSANVRSRETATTLYESLREHVTGDVSLRAPREEWAIRNPDLFLAGRRIEMVSTPEAMAEQIQDSGITAAIVDQNNFYNTFFRSPDRVGYWLHHPGPPGEDARAVGRRIVTYGMSLLDAPSERTKRFVCVTHSPVMRAVLVHYLVRDPGEPGWVENVDLALHPDGSSITFRDETVPLRLRDATTRSRY